MNRLKSRVAALAGLTLLTCLTTAQVQSFYTIDADTDYLKIVDTTGNVVNAGGVALGQDMVNPDLAWHQGTLYALDQSSLYSIQTMGPLAGSATFRATIKNNVLGGGVMEGEALASDGTSLWLSFGTPGSNLSTNWGTVSLLGNITPWSIGPDWDGAGFDGSTFWGVDLYRLGDPTQNYIHSGFPVPNGFASMHANNNTWDENDLVASIGNSLYFITSASDMITHTTRALGH